MNPKFWDELKTLSYVTLIILACLIGFGIYVGILEHNDSRRELAMSSFNKGIEYYRNQNYDKAIKWFANALRISREALFEKMHIKVETNYWLGNAYVKKKMLDKAMDSYLSALQKDSEYPEAYYGLARVFSLMDEKQKAIEALSEAIERRSELLKSAKKDKAFSNFRDTTEFNRIVNKSLSRGLNNL